MHRPLALARGQLATLPIFSGASHRALIPSVRTQLSRQHHVPCRLCFRQPAQATGVAYRNCARVQLRRCWCRNTQSKGVYTCWVRWVFADFIVRLSEAEESGDSLTVVEVLAEANAMGVALPAQALEISVRAYAKGAHAAATHSTAPAYTSDSYNHQAACVPCTCGMTGTVPTAVACTQLPHENCILYTYIYVRTACPSARLTGNLSIVAIAHCLLLAVAMWATCPSCPS